MITVEVKDFFKKFKVERACEVDHALLGSMTGPVIDGVEKRNIIDIFISDKYLDDDKNGSLASFVVLSEDDIPLGFFSLRCGELFEETSVRKMQICHNAYVAINILMDERANPGAHSEEELNAAFGYIKHANEEGFSFDDFEPLEDKKKAWKYDEVIDAGKEVNKVFKSYPAVELKLFGTNSSANAFWKTLGLPADKKMGEVLFWTKVVDAIRDVLSTVGCQYVYLFAADEEAEGQLVQYYRVRLGFDADVRKSANKPRFDWDSQFLFQSVDSLFSSQEHFLNTFNT